MALVKSSFLHSIDHDPDSETLIVVFKNGGLYTYDGVSADLHARLMAADSVGKYFTTYIKDVFAATKIPVAAAASTRVSP